MHPPLHKPGQLPADLLDAAVELMGRAGRGGTVHVTGRSMEPTLVEGQLLAVEFAPAEPCRGDLLVFRQADYLVVHRLAGAATTADGHRYLRMRGDARIGLDPPVDLDRVIGRVIAFKDGEVWKSVRTPGARRYAALLGWHGLFWAGIGVLASLGDRAMRKLGMSVDSNRWAAAMDRWLLTRAHHLLAHRVHHPTEVPVHARESALDAE